ncbi:Isochorismatase-like protein [Aspergillus karnatakaensis]|uniref:Isochorismatase-like protein n=1 Tax=Aspergillus karnatakaensis TaxID=1810916 RepID=UPI003CCDEA41
MAISFKAPTALLLIDNQKAFGLTSPSTPCHWGTARSNPSLEANLTALITAFRAAKAKAPSSSLEVIHVFHSSILPDSALHPSANNGINIQPLPFAAPLADDSETVFWKSVNSAFIGTGLESYLRARGIRQLIVAGITTDHCVSTSVRMAANLKVVDRFPEGEPALRDDGTQEGGVVVDKGRIVLVGDATATWAKGGFDAETVHAVTLASLDEEFVDVLGTQEVVAALKAL